MGHVMLQALRHFSEAVSDLKAALAIEPANKELGSQLQQAELALSESKLSASVQAKLGAATQSPTRKSSGAPQSASSQPAPAKASPSQNGEEGEVGGIRAVHAASLQPAAATGSASSSSKLGAVADACKRLQAAGVCMPIAADLEVMSHFAMMGCSLSRLRGGNPLDVPAQPLQGCRRGAHQLSALPCSCICCLQAFLLHTTRCRQTSAAS